MENNKIINTQIFFWKYLFIFSFFVNLAFFGSFLNHIALMQNGWKMPVYSQEYFITDNLHFTFSDKSSVNFFYLTDIFNISNLYFSIGDLIMFIAFSFTIAENIFIFYIILEHKKQYKQQNYKEICEVKKKLSKG